MFDPAVEHMMNAVHCSEGTVTQMLGDGIMALFRAPHTYTVEPCLFSFHLGNEQTVEKIVVVLGG